MSHRHPQPLLRSLAALVGATLILGCVPPRAAGQYNQDRAAPSSTLLRRLAEAVDAQRDNRAVWVVVQPQAPYDVRGLFHSQAEAAAVATALTGYAVFGPYANAPDSGVQTMMLTVDPCPGRHSSSSQCPDTTFGSSAAIRAMPVETVDSVVVTIYGQRAVPIHRTFGGGDVDALFFTLSAIDKFAIPYYSRLYGPAVAARMRSDYVRRLAQAR
ncbi:MAG TPA: hypothetical protein VNG95_06005 [Gemmatimonadales bacterium]|nr:hypothetical protein [Gemmatimonadales bacterium]